MDTLANMLTTIMNAQRVRKERVVLPHSKIKESLARFLHQRELVGAVRVQDGVTPKLVITLAYSGLNSKIRNLRRISKPGLRQYVNHSQLPYSGNRPSFFVVSTSKGLMDEVKARDEKLGGELLCEVIHIN